MQRLVVVGASLAGLRAAQSARSAGHEGGLVLIGQEQHLPYTRPPLSKEYLQGKQTIDESAFRLGELDVEWRLGTAATGLDRARRRVQLADRPPRSNTTGWSSQPVPGPCTWSGPGAELDGVHTLRNLEDGHRPACHGSSQLATCSIVGAGFIGCEVAASARALGLRRHS